MMKYDLLGLDQATIQMILKALSDLPLKFSLPHFMAIEAQVREQDKARAVEVEGDVSSD